MVYITRDQGDPLQGDSSLSSIFNIHHHPLGYHIGLDNLFRA